MCSAMPGRHQSHLCGPSTTSVATTASQIVISPCNTVCVLSLQPQQPCGPQPSPVAIITLLCVLTLPQWPQKTPLWSSAYPCSHHSILLVLSLSMQLSQLSACPQRILKAKKPTFVVLTAYPCHQQRSYMFLRLLLYHHSTMCILSLPQFPQKATFVVLSQPFS